jgi:hypothetical protein
MVGEISENPETSDYADCETITLIRNALKNLCNLSLESV